VPRDCTLWDEDDEASKDKLFASLRKIELM